ncbi:galactosyldiacylglycerol synthase [Halobacillus rhizosphaerae]|uniref:MGDG synthase family glycosyltransferase n=1 Tax=Halobacillus rhizosphaerae TaxID=3064889 RepID=UPI00398B6CA6
MNKILFLPLFQMPSGHHHAADAIIDGLKSRSEEIECKKIDFLSDISPFLEKSVASFYLKWIKASPKTYNLAYQRFSYTNEPDKKPYLWYERLFLNKMEQLIIREKPTLIICTHGFPSYFVSRLKMKHKINIPVINIYTDFFINDIWGKEGIDYHVVPNLRIKKQLEKNDRVSPERIICSGIPVHEVFTEKIKISPLENKENYSILVAGGSSGLGNMSELLEEVRSSNADFKILCGNNGELYEQIVNLNHEKITPVPYLSSKQAMNKLYEECDAIVTKPGGITISEALKKHLPIFIHSSLPGQEKINEEFLAKEGLVFLLNKENSYIDQMMNVLEDPILLRDYLRKVENYNQQLESSIQVVYSIVEKIILEGQRSYVIAHSLKQHRFPFLKRMTSKYNH